MDWGVSTAKQTKDGLNVYLHLLTHPKDGKIFVPGIAKGTEVTCLADGRVCSSQVAEDDFVGGKGLLVEVGPAPADGMPLVLELVVKDASKVGPFFVKQQGDVINLKP